MGLYDNQLPYSNDYPLEKLYEWELKGRSLWNKNKPKWLKDELNKGEIWYAREWLKKHDGKLMIMNDLYAFRIGVIIRDGMIDIYDTDGLTKGKSLRSTLECGRNVHLFLFVHWIVLVWLRINGCMEQNGIWHLRIVILLLWMKCAMKYVLMNVQESIT